MKTALAFFPTDLSMPPGPFAKAAEERGFESVWFAEHSHMPVSPMTPGPEGPGLPREYYAAADPFVALALAAAATTTLRIGTGICLVPQRDIFQTAKQVASLDLYSDGRFLFGIGGGWNQPEVENHGIAHSDRFAIQREKIEAMKQLWTEEKAEYHGDHVNFDPCYAWPKPAQRPHPPIHVGGAGRPAIRRAARYGDGWIPLLGGDENNPLDLVPMVRDELRAAGRPEDDLELSLYFCPPDPDTVARARDAGFHRVLFAAPSATADEALPRLDELAKLMS